MKKQYLQRMIVTLLAALLPLAFFSCHFFQKGNSAEGDRVRWQYILTASADLETVERYFEANYETVEIRLHREDLGTFLLKFAEDPGLEILEADVETNESLLAIQRNHERRTYQQ